MTTEAADPVEAVAVSPAADPGFLQRYGTTIEYILIPGAALVGALAVFGFFVALFGKNPLDLYFYMYQGAFGTWFSWQNTLTRAAPLILTALCTALPAQLGLVIIGGETVSPEAWNLWHRRAPNSIKLINAYGLTDRGMRSLLINAGVIWQPPVSQFYDVTPINLTTQKCKLRYP